MASGELTGTINPDIDQPEILPGEPAAIADGYPGYATPLVLTGHYKHHDELQYDWTLEHHPDFVAPYLTGTSNRLSSFVRDIYAGVFHRRLMRNHESAHHLFGHEIPANIHPVFKAAEEGRAEPDDLITMMHGLKMPSIELSKVVFQGDLWESATTHVRDRLIGAFPALSWKTDTVDKPAMIGRALTIPVPNDPGESRSDTTAAKTFAGKEAIKAEPKVELEAFTVRARLYRGEIDPQTKIRQVISLIVRMDEKSGFNEWFKQRYPYRYSDGRPFSRTLQNLFEPTVAAHYSLGSNAKLMSALNEVITSDFGDLPSWVIPVSSTVYAFNPLHTEQNTIPRYSSVPREVAERLLAQVTEVDEEARRQRLFETRWNKHYESMKKPKVVP